MASIRNTVITKLTDIVQEKNLTINVEKSIFNNAIRSAKKLRTNVKWENPRFKRLYTAKARSIIWNLKNPKNPNLLLKLKDESIDAKKIAFMEPWELFPEMYQPIFDKFEARVRNTLDFDNLDNAVETDFQCAKCKSHKCVYYSLQTRSADEPMTNYFTCLQCQNKWKD